MSSKGTGRREAKLKSAGPQLGKCEHVNTKNVTPVAKGVFEGQRPWPPRPRGVSPLALHRKPPSVHGAQHEPFISNRMFESVGFAVSHRYWADGPAALPCAEEEPRPLPGAEPGVPAPIKTHLSAFAPMQPFFLDVAFFQQDPLRLTPPDGRLDPPGRVSSVTRVNTWRGSVGATRPTAR